MANGKLPDINTILIAGTLLDEPEFTQSDDGKLVGKFRIFNVRRYKDNSGQWRENRCEVDVLVYHRLAELCQRNLHAGSPVLLDGELLSREADQEGARGTLEIRARRVQFLERILRSRTAEVEETPEETPEAVDLEEQAPTEFDFGYRELEL